jgi:hypothetical protein
MGQRLQRHVVAAVMMLAVVGGGGVMWLLLHSVPTNHLHIETSSRTVKQGGDLLLGYTATPDMRECEATVRIGATNGIEYTILYEGDMFTTEQIQIDKPSAVFKRVSFPEEITPGKTRIDVDGRFGCNVAQRWKPKTVGLGNVIIDVKGTEEDRVTQLNNTIVELSQRLSNLHARIDQLELIDELRLRYSDTSVVIPVAPIPEPKKSAPAKKTTLYGESKLSTVPQFKTEHKDLGGPRISKRDLPQGFTDWIGNINLGD